MDKKKENKYKIKASKLKFTKQRWKYHQELAVIANEEFSDTFKKYVKNMPDGTDKDRLLLISGIKTVEEMDKKYNPSEAAKNAKRDPIKQRKQENEQQNQQIEPAEKPKMPPEYKSLYRKVALKTHPDRLAEMNQEEKEEKREILVEVNEAVEKQDYQKLIEAAILLDIELSEEMKFDTIFIDKKIEEYEKKIKKILDSVSWGWYNRDNEKEKEFVLIKYAEFLLKNFLL